MCAEQKTATNRKGLLVQAFIVLTLLLLAATAITMSLYRSFQTTEISLPEKELVYSIPAGTSLKQLAFDLHRRGIIDQPRFLILLGRQLDVARRLKTGEYTFVQGMTPRSLLQQVTDGRVIQYSLTLVEGQTFREILERIFSHPVIENTLDGLDDGEIMARLGHPGEHPEGRFLPDTYNFPRSTTDLAFLRRAYNAMAERLQAEWEGRQEGLPFKSAEEALILASIVEKETGRVEERPVIAGVFVRRLQKGMKLQTDPTVIYGMGETFDGNIRLRDLRKDTPYNTYTRTGLPPTPIAMPGVDAIHAVLHPADGDSLYFVAMGEGRHYFSSTLEQHNRAVDKFQRKKQGIKLPASGYTQ
jgi:UPF0755 protein